jgi:hypothetical protein
VRSTPSASTDAKPSPTAGGIVRDRPHYLPGAATADQAPTLPGMSATELTVADMWVTGIAPTDTPVDSSVNTSTVSVPSLLLRPAGAALAWTLL